MKRYRFPMIVKQDEDGMLVGIVPDLKGCHSQAKTLADLEKRMKEAIQLCLRVQKHLGPQNKFVGVHQLDVAVR